MHQPAKAAFVFAKGHGAREPGLAIATVLASPISHQQLRAEEAIAAKHALRFPYGRNGQTFRADRDSRDVIERRAA